MHIQSRLLRKDRQERLDFGGKEQPSPAARVEQGPNSQAIPDQDQSLPSRVPQGDCELSVQSLDEALAVLLVGMDDDLGVRAGPKPMTQALQLSPQLDIVEDFTVEYGPDRAVLVRHRLGAGLKIDDAEACVGQHAQRGLEVFRAIRSTVTQHGDHG